MFDEFKGANNLKLYGDNILTIRGEENFRKLQNIFAKTNFKNVESNEENFKQTIEKIKKVLLKEKIKWKIFMKKLKKFLTIKMKKTLLEC